MSRPSVGQLQREDKNKNFGSLRKSPFYEVGFNIFPIFGFNIPSSLLLVYGAYLQFSQITLELRLIRFPIIAKV